MKYFFATYGDAKYKKSKTRILKEAKNFGFNNCVGYSPTDIDSYFLNSTSRIIIEERGGGYWIWKPWVLKKSFELMKDGDLLVYADSGCEINKEGFKRFLDYINIAKLNNGTFAFSLDNKIESNFTKKDVFDYFKIKDEKIINSNQLVGGVLIFIKNEFTASIIDEFYNSAVFAPYLFDDSKTIFCRSNHRHDQSVFSLIRKLKNVKSIPDETYFKNWKLGNDYPFLAKRKADLNIKRAFVIIINRTKRILNLK